MSLRKTTRGSREHVWEFRNGKDAYTHLTRAQITKEDQNIDHVLEIQLVAHATAESLTDNEELAKRMRDLVNEPYNLNVTSKRVNQAKRGPFTAALNRLKKRDGTLREISVEQLARSGRAKHLVDDGTWANVTKEVVVSYDALSARTTQSRLTRKQSTLLVEAIDNLHGVLEKIQIL